MSKLRIRSDVVIRIYTAELRHLTEFPSYIEALIQSSMDKTAMLFDKTEHWDIDA